MKPNINAPTSPLLTIEEAATLAKVTPRTIHGWKAARAISFMKLGRVVRLERETFLAELRAFTHPAAA